MSQGMVAPPPVGQAASLPTVQLQSTSQRFIPRPDPLFHAILLGLCATVLVLAVVLSIRGSTQVVLPLLNVPLPELCMMKRYTGLTCPGCGLTRCFIALAHGDLPAAMAYNPRRCRSVRDRRLTNSASRLPNLAHPPRSLRTINRHLGPNGPPGLRHRPPGSVDNAAARRNLLMAIVNRAND